MEDQSGVAQETGPIVSPLLLETMEDQSGVAQETGPIVSPLLLETMEDQSGVTQETGPIVSPLLLETLEDQSGVTQETGPIVSPLLLETMEDQSGVTQETGQSLPQMDEEISGKRSRKRQRNEKQWKKNITKLRKNSGQSYVTSSGIIKRAKLIQSGCGLNCKNKCQSKINSEQREKIFHEY